MTFTAESLPSLAGKVYIVTGGNSGIGHSTVIGLARKGARVYMASRSEERALPVIEEIKKQLPDTDVRFLPLDNMRFASVLEAVRSFKAQETQLHGLINNAGVMSTEFSLSEDGYENQFQTNYLSHWLLTYHLLPLLEQTAATGSPSSVRIVNVSSSGHSMLAPKEGICFADVNMQAEGTHKRYGQSKLANVLHTRQLNRLYGPGSGKTSEIWMAAVHPGLVQTGLLREAAGFGPPCVRRAFTGVFSRTPLMHSEVDGARPSLWSAAGADFPREASGAYVVQPAKVSKASALGRDDALAAKLWGWTAGQMQERGLLVL